MSLVDSHQLAKQKALWESLKCSGFIPMVQNQLSFFKVIVHVHYLFLFLHGSRQKTGQDANRKNFGTWGIDHTGATSFGHEPPWPKCTGCCPYSLGLCAIFNYTTYCWGWWLRQPVRRSCSFKPRSVLSLGLTLEVGRQEAWVGTSSWNHMTPYVWESYDRYIWQFETYACIYHFLKIYIYIVF